MHSSETSVRAFPTITTTDTLMPINTPWVHRFSNWIHSNSPRLDWIGLIWFRIHPGTLALLPGNVLTSP
ncbi:hypothetical protein PIB30_006640 [Stylosanthes scabra]|uniref:Uncharacterized protein n=1 Tax=Stylosanthes scabra TaxID=79078 RepID=A0ABU6Q4C6_9FABA|nr:hypothetical protein [Stylosanthes scabra]